MATLNAHGSFYRIQDNINRVQQDLGNNMQRLSSGLKNIAAGSRPGDVAIVKSMEAGVATLEYGKANAEAGVAALEMAVADLSRLSDIITRLYEMNQIGGNIFTTADDKAMLKLEVVDLAAEYNLVGNNITYRGQDLAAGSLDIEVGSVVFGSVTTNLGFGTVGTAPSATATEVSGGTAITKLKADKKTVDELRLDAASRYNMAAWHAMHASNHLAATKIEVGSYRDVDFAAETSELAKNQIIAQAGTAMLAQANAQGQGVLALLQT
jgi:flagellin